MSNDVDVEATPDCDHHWSSTHYPGAALYWVTTCTLCRTLDVRDMNEQVDKVKDERALMWKELGARQAEDAGKLVAFNRAIVDAVRNTRDLLSEGVHGESADPLNAAETALLMLNGILRASGETS